MKSASSSRRSTALGRPRRPGLLPSSTILPASAARPRSPRMSGSSPRRRSPANAESCTRDSHRTAMRAYAGRSGCRRWSGAVQSVAPRLLRAAHRRRQAAQSRFDRRDAQAPRRRLRRRQEPPPLRAHPQGGRRMKKALARRHGISGRSGVKRRPLSRAPPSPSVRSAAIRALRPLGAGTRRILRRRRLLNAPRASRGRGARSGSMARAKSADGPLSWTGWRRSPPPAFARSTPAEWGYIGDPYVYQCMRSSAVLR
jgi:hypothetical protein